MFWVLPVLIITSVAAIVSAAIPSLPEHFVLWGRYHCLTILLAYICGGITFRHLHPYVVVIGNLQLPYGNTIGSLLVMVPIMFTVLHYVPIV